MHPPTHPAAAPGVTGWGQGPMERHLACDAWAWVARTILWHSSEVSKLVSVIACWETNHTPEQRDAFWLGILGLAIMEPDVTAPFTPKFLKSVGSKLPTAVSRNVPTTDIPSSPISNAGYPIPARFEGKIKAKRNRALERHICFLSVLWAAPALMLSSLSMCKRE